MVRTMYPPFMPMWLPCDIYGVSAGCTAVELISRTARQGVQDVKSPGMSAPTVRGSKRCVHL